MDLDRRVDRAAANRVINRVIARTGDAGLSRGLPPFLSMRAMVRAHVRATAGQAEEARSYLAAAQAYLAQSPAFVLAIGGLQGTGKSTLARILAPEFGAAPGAVVLRSDEIRKRLHSVAPEDRLPESAYSDQASAAVNDVLVEQARSVAAGGHTVIVDATFLDPEFGTDWLLTCKVPWSDLSASGCMRRCLCWRRALAHGMPMHPTPQLRSYVGQPQEILVPWTGCRLIRLIAPRRWRQFDGWRSVTLRWIEQVSEPGVLERSQLGAPNGDDVARIVI